MTGVQTCALPISSATEIYTRLYTLSLHDALPIAGLTVPEIARAFLSSEQAMERRLTRARRKVTDAEMATLNIKGDAFHPEWNYTISPRQPP